MYLRRNIFTIILMFIAFILGICSILIDPNIIIKIIMYILAIILVIVAISFLIKSRIYLGKDKKMLIVQSICLIIISFALFLVPSQIMRIIIGVLFIIYPLIFMFTVNNKFARFKKDLPKYFIGILLILSLDSILKILMIIIGAAFILIGLYFGLLLILNCRNPEKPNILLKVGMRLFFRKENMDKWEL